MKKMAAAVSLSLASLGSAGAEQILPPSAEEVRRVSPALEKYNRDMMVGDLWVRSELTPRDRSIVTVAVLVARGHTVDMPHHFDLALKNGVKPSELSEIITHLAFYSGWANAMSAVPIAKAVFDRHNVRSDQIPVASPELLPIDEASEAQRAARVEEAVGSVSPGLVKFTGDLLFKDLWLRPDLAPRDRSLVTVSALIATGQVAQMTFHLNRAMDNGLTDREASEILTQTAFYAGWPNAFSAVPVVSDVLKSRKK